MERSCAALLEHLSVIEDVRDPWRVAHPLPEVLLLVVCGTICDCDDYDAIAEMFLLDTRQYRSKQACGGGVRTGCAEAILRCPPGRRRSTSGRRSLRAAAHGETAVYRSDLLLPDPRPGANGDERGPFLRPSRLQRPSRFI